jgi:ammonia channel protein AmtB
MVLLGLFIGIFTNGDQWFYRQSTPLRSDEHAWQSKSWVASDSGPVVLILSGTLAAQRYNAFSRILADLDKMQFCAVTGAIVMGAVAERGRMIPAMVFIFIWATLVYCPIACWAWNINGWGYVYGVLDYAGGGPVEIGSGMSALAYSMVLGRRQERMMLNFRPHNVSLILLGTVFLWFGWLGFNGGSSFGANLRATMACWNSNLTAMFAAITWVLLDWRLARKWSMVGWCSGTISGLVAATPASGYLTPWGSIILGIITGGVCNWATKSMCLAEYGFQIFSLTFGSQILDQDR